MRRTILAAVLVASTGTAFAGPRDFIVEHAGAGANAENAQPYIDQLLRIIEQMVHWPANSAKGVWVDDLKAAEAQIAQMKPGYAIFDPEVFLELRKKEALEPVAIVKGKTFNKGHYNLVVKGASPYKTIADLKGKTVSSNHLASPKYVDRVAFEGKLAIEKDFVPKRAAAPAKPIKDVEAGRADAALIDDEQLAQMKEIAPDLKVIWTSPALPPTPVVAFGKIATTADRAALAKALPQLCQGAQHKQVCDSMFIDTFATVDKGAFAAAEKRYDAAEGGAATQKTGKTRRSTEKASAK